jgi:hypothetical protein
MCGLDCCSRVRQQRLAGGGQLDAAGAAAKQRRADRPLELADARAQGGLGHVQPLGRPGEVKLLGHR